MSVMKQCLGFRWVWLHIDYLTNVLNSSDTRSSQRTFWSEENLLLTLLGHRICRAAGMSSIIIGYASRISFRTATCLRSIRLCLSNSKIVHAGELVCSVNNANVQLCTVMLMRGGIKVASVVLPGTILNAVYGRSAFLQSKRNRGVCILRVYFMVNYLNGRVPCAIYIQLDYGYNHVIILFESPLCFLK